MEWQFKFMFMSSVWFQFKEANILLENQISKTSQNFPSSFISFHPSSSAYHPPNVLSLYCKYQEINKSLDNCYIRQHHKNLIYSTFTIMCRSQSYKTFYTLGQIYKLVIKLDNMLWLREYLVRILGHYTLKYSQGNIS